MVEGVRERGQQEGGNGVDSTDLDLDLTLRHLSVPPLTSPAGNTTS